MSDDEYEGWVASHCAATAASADAAVSLLSAEVRRAFGDWGATAGELGECTFRLVRFVRVPKFASEHAESVAAELLALRRDRGAAEAPDHSADYYAGDSCHLCGRSGLVGVPVPVCVRTPRDDPPYLVNYPGTRAVLTGAVLCDAPGCAAGRAARDRETARKSDRPRPTYSAYCRRFGGTDVASLLAAAERDLARAVRARPDGGDQRDVRDAIAQLRKRVAA